MLGLMQDAQLLTSATLAHAARVYPGVEIATADDGQIVHRITYAEADQRARLLASSMERLGLTGEGVFVGALAFNTWRLFEVMHGVPGAGGVLHTANPRLHERHLTYTIRHTEDRAVLVDLDCLPLAEAIAPECPSVRHWIVMAGRHEMPATTL
ncbi:MAG TPA: AMP-binding protein, partial [Alphaproteobacteria bacterium]|nr:AMP-binding protein [Alphaproteobacteria bacterium]